MVLGGGDGALGFSHNVYENENDGSVKRDGGCRGGDMRTNVDLCWS